MCYTQAKVVLQHLQLSPHVTVTLITNYSATSTAEYISMLLVTIITHHLLTTLPFQHIAIILLLIKTVKSKGINK